MLNKERKIKFFNLSMISRAKKMGEENGTDLESFVIKNSNERALDSYWTNLIERSKKLDKLNIPMRKKIKKFELHAWPEFLKYVVTKMGDGCLPNPIIYENGAIYLSKKKIFPDV